MNPFLDGRQKCPAVPTGNNHEANFITTILYHCENPMTVDTPPSTAHRTPNWYQQSITEIFGTSRVNAQLPTAIFKATNLTNRQILAYLPIEESLCKDLLQCYSELHGNERNEDDLDSYETGNGIHAEEAGYIKNKGDEKHETLVQHGKVTYHDEHGHPITITYVADEHGFQVQGDHLPTPPPIPKEILEGLAKHQHYLHEEEEQQGHVQQDGYEEHQQY
nr:unnamed protein product [Callosobruchus analis]